MGTKRLFIVGAGSSIDFDFPLGIDLMESIYMKWKIGFLTN